MGALDEELNIPKDAMLVLPGRTAAYCSIVCGGNGIDIDKACSIRQDSEPRCLIIGRQASSADIRIDHGSISRRHAAIYYKKTAGSGGTSANHYSLILQDLGGKHGTHVKGVKLEKRSIVVNNGDEIIFGNMSEQVFLVQIPPDFTISAPSLHVDKTVTQEKATITREEGDENMGGFSGQNPKTSKTAEEAGVGLSGRAKREAEIAAMMESLEDTPMYEKYVSADFEEEQESALKSASPAFNKKKPDLSSIDPTVSVSRELQLPVTKSAIVPAIFSGSKPSQITAVALDLSGSRMVIGTTDTNLRFHDFNGMDSSFRPFKQVEVEEGHHIVDVCYSNTGDRILVGTGSAQPKVLDRDGSQIIQFIKGDVYVTDQSKTTGHTATVTGVAWHPLERDLVLTCSIDGSARIWNLNGKTQFKKLVCDKVYRAKNARGQRVGVTAVIFHPGGRELALATSCGSIQIWNTTRVGNRPDRVVYDAHGTARPIHKLTYNVDGTLLASRSMDDDAVKVWDAKRLNKSCEPILVCPGLSSLSESANVAFSPKGNFVCAGTSVEPARKGHDSKESSKLKFFAVPTGRSKAVSGLPVLEINVAQGASATRVVWHPKLNQIFIGCSNGSTRIFFDPDLSTKGALLSTARSVRKADGLSELLASRAPLGSMGDIITPHALPMFRDEHKRNREEDRQDPVKSRRPEPPAAGIKTGGQTSVSVNFQQYVAKGTIKTKNIAGRDPREELFKYTEGKSYTSAAYDGEETKILTEKTVEQEEEEMNSQK